MQIVRSWLSDEAVRALAEEVLGGVLHVVVDVRRGIVAAGGTPHVTGAQQLIADGSRREDLWGVIYLPHQALGKRVEYAASINQEHSANQQDFVIQDPQVRERVQAVLVKCFGGV